MTTDETYIRIRSVVRLQQLQAEFIGVTRAVGVLLDVNVAGTATKN